MPPRRLGRQPALDGVRGLAVLLVVIYHVGLPLPGGGVGVDVFFVLSGFLISTLLLTERDETGTIAFGAFYARRARRLLPALLLMMALFVVIRGALGPWLGVRLLGSALPWWQTLLAPLLFASNWVAMHGNNEALGALTPTWSLAAEEQFYLLWPAALWLLTRRRVRPLALFGALAVVGLGLVWYAHKIPVTHPTWIPYFNPFDRGAELLAGCGAALLWRYRRTPALLRTRTIGWGALALLLAIAARDAVPPLAAGSPDTSWLDSQLTYLSAAAAACVLVLGVLHHPHGDLAGLLSARPLRYLGRISYGLYLFNLPTIAVVRSLLPHLGTLRSGALAAAIAFALAAASWHLLEARVLAARRRTPERRPAEPPANQTPAPTEATEAT
jgi:peptidoglycan/LPS O-acetylase OafA/YrhL